LKHFGRVSQRLGRQPGSSRIIPALQLDLREIGSDRHRPASASHGAGEVQAFHERGLGPVEVSKKHARDPQQEQRYEPPTFRSCLTDREAAFQQHDCAARVVLEDHGDLAEPGQGTSRRHRIAGGEFCTFSPKS
jgi:hypothetical protein